MRRIAAQDTIKPTSPPPSVGAKVAQAGQSCWIRQLIGFTTAHQPEHEKAESHVSMNQQILAGDKNPTDSAPRPLAFGDLTIGMLGRG
jgi:hypothetical protein